MPWKVFAASAAGKYHLDDSQPCEDAVGYGIAQDTLIGVVCDGAGSAAAGGDGARRVVQDMVETLARSLRAADGAVPAATDEASALIRGAVAQVRAGLCDHAAARGLVPRDFACTLVGCMVGAGGGWFFHVGDGMAVFAPAAGPACLSRPENGEYADQTYFVTDDDWTEHLRLTALAAPGAGTWVGVMSDGVCPFAIDRARTGFFGPFFDPVRRYLETVEPQDGERALHEVLASERTWAITADDKTLLLARYA